MNDAQLETLLLSARLRPDEYSPLTQSVMQQITQRAVVQAQLHDARPSKRSLFSRVRMLHGAGLVVAIIMALLLVTGAVYASTQFVPDLIKVFNKKHNSIGRIEYDAPAFAHCYIPGGPPADKFEVSAAANLSDQEVEKVLRAKCELMEMDKFARTTWPTYGQHKVWQDGDSIYYTRPDILGEVASIGTKTMTLRYSGGAVSTTDYTSFNGQPILAYSRGQRIDASTIRPGDFVFTVVRVSETYHSPQTLTGSKAAQVMQQSPPKPLGLVAVVKMSLPERYYTSMQAYVHPVVLCPGNTSERCSNDPGGYMIDVFPHDEGLTNPYARHDPKAVGREVNGTVTAITQDGITLKASSGTLYIIAIDKSIIDDYNNAIAPGYPDGGVDQVRVGSWLDVIYQQSPSENHTHIAVQDITVLQLITGQQFKK